MKSRIYFLDNLRTFLILLVVLLHSGLVYETSGMPAAWWIVDDPQTTEFADLINFFVDIFVMFAVFFVSGFFTPRAFERKGLLKFLTDKVMRLLVPWLIAVFTLIPLYKVIFLASRSLSQEHWTSYFHFSNGIWGLNWLWFLPVLFIFNVLHILVSKIKINVSTGKAATMLLVLGIAYSFGMDFFKLQGWTKTPFFDFQNERVFIYFLYFLLGVHSYKVKLFEEKVHTLVYVLLTAASVILVPLHLMFYIFRLLNPTLFLVNGIVDGFLFAFSFHTTLFVLITVLMLTFKKFVNSQNKILKEFSSNTYGVYILHTVLLGACACLLAKIDASAELKLFTLAVATYFLSTLIVGIYKRVKGVVNKVLLSKGRSMSSMMFILVVCMITAGSSSLSCCSPGLSELEKINFTPEQDGERSVSPPEKQGLNSQLFAGAYYNAS